jgi:hypothetical protein
MIVIYCQADGCRIPVPRAKPFCRKHWVMVPWHLKVKMADVYILGQFEEGGKAPKHDWFYFIREAKLAVQDFESNPANYLHG